LRWRIPAGQGSFETVLRRTVLLGLLAAAALAPASAHAAVQLAKVGTFSAPVYVTAPPGDVQRLFVVEQAGRIQLMVGTQKQATPFLDISGEVRPPGGEQGLLSMAFPPDYATSGKFYVYYTTRNCDSGGGCDEHLSQFTRSASNPNVADPGSERVLLSIPHPGNTNHNGGQLQFGPDGYLYVSTGDGGDSNDTHHNAQKTDDAHLLGKILRLDPANPAASVPGNIPGTRIYAYGLRNPWRFSFDRLTGDMIIGDVGQSAREEIDFAHFGQNAGANYGWPCFEGSQQNSAASGYDECNPLPSETAPVFDYGHSGTPFTGEGIIGGYVVRDPSLPDLYGRYIYGDLYTSGTKGLRSITLPAAGDDQSLPLNVSGLSSFGEDALGCVYAASQSNGGVWRLAPDTNPTPGPCGSSGPITAPAKDTTAPSLSLRRRRRQRVLRTHSISVGAVSNELSSFTATATVGVARRASATLRFKRATRRNVAAGKRVTLKLRLSKRTLRSLRRAMRHHRSRLAHVTVTARDSSGNARSRRLTVRLVH
jgi:glucose/arabinose dehydrogenase